MNNNNNEIKDQETQGTQETGKESTRVSQNSGIKSTFAKRWTFPVIYLAASVLIVGLMYAKSQDASPYQIDKTKSDVGNETAGPLLPSGGADQAAQPTNSTPSLIWPVGEGGEDATVSMDFYRDTASDDEKAAALVVFENNYIPNEGVNIGLKSDTTFTVVAAAKGTVANVSEDPLMGHVIEIDHGNGYSTYYASLSSVEVKKGSIVLQGQPIAKTGNNRFEKDQQNHLHFELRKDGQAIDPVSMLPKKDMGAKAKSASQENEQRSSTQTGAGSYSTPLEKSSSVSTTTPSSSTPSTSDDKSKSPSEDNVKSTTKPAEKSTQTPEKSDALKNDSTTSSESGASTDTR